MPFTPTNPLAELPVNFNALIFAASMAGRYHPPPNHEYLSLILHVFMASIGVIFPPYLSDFFKEERALVFMFAIKLCPFRIVTKPLKTLHICVFFFSKWEVALS